MEEEREEEMKEDREKEMEEEGRRVAAVVRARPLPGLLSPGQVMRP